MIKREKYNQSLEQLNALIEENVPEVTKMATISCILHKNFPSFSWVGFYLLDETKETLWVGPYQGTMGCLSIELGKGVCGTVAKTEITKIISDCKKEENHIFCDENTLSEIVLPVKKGDNLIGVLDIDSHVINNFDGEDALFLDKIITTFF